MAIRIVLGVDVISIIWLCLDYLFFVPLCVGFTYIYYQRRKEKFLQLRRPKLVLMCNIIYIYLLAFHMPFLLLTSITPSAHIHIPSLVPFLRAMQVELTLLPLLARVWHTFYDFKLYFANIHRIWSQILINEEIKSYQGSFWVQWNQRLNNARNTMITFSIIIIFTAILFSIDSKSGGVGYAILYFITLFSFVALAVFAVVLWKINVAYDSAFIRNELFFSCILFCSFMIVSLIFGIIADASLSNGNTTTALTIYSIQLCLIATAVYIASVLCNTFLVFKAINIDQIRQTLFSDYMENTAIAEENKSQINIYKIEIPFKDIDIYSTLQHEYGLHLFMGYLMNEESLDMDYGFDQFKNVSDTKNVENEKRSNSVEKLIFLIEATQFHQFLNEKTRTRNKNAAHLKIFEIEKQVILFPDGCLPLSVIVHDNISPDSKNPNLKFLLFCKKYFLLQSPYYIQLNDAAKPALNEIYPRLKHASTKIEHGSPFPSSPTETSRYLDKFPVLHLNAAVLEIQSSLSFSNSAVIEDNIHVKQMENACEIFIRDVLSQLLNSYQSYTRTKNFRHWFRYMTSIEAQKMQFRKKIHTQELKFVKKLDHDRNVQQWICSICTKTNFILHFNDRWQNSLPSYCHLCGNNNTLQDMNLSMTLDTVHIEEELEQKLDFVPIPLLTPQLSECELFVSYLSDIIPESKCNGNETKVTECEYAHRLLFILQCYSAMQFEEPSNKNAKQNVFWKKFKECNFDSLQMILQLLPFEYEISKILDDYQHICAVHDQRFVVEFFKENIGECTQMKCRSLQRNSDGNRFRMNIKTDELNISPVISDKNIERKRYQNEEINGLDSNSNSNQESILLHFLDSIHYGLFHTTLMLDRDRKLFNDHKKRQRSRNDDKYYMIIENENTFSAESVSESDSENVTSLKIENEFNKTSNHSSTSDIGPSFLKNKSTKYQLDATLFTCAAEKSNENYYEYAFGVGGKIDYLKYSPAYNSMKDELMSNNVHTISNESFDFTLFKALAIHSSKFIKNIKPHLEKPFAEQYGVINDDHIDIDHIMSILFYTDYDKLQAEFSSTFRSLIKKNIDSSFGAENEEKKDEDHQTLDMQTQIAIFHCSNFYWFGRSLYIAINFYGEKMSRKMVVYQGLSHQMLFEDFACYYDCPTSTTIDLLVAQKFAGDLGIILQLKSQFKAKSKCSSYFDVSLFSNFRNEEERLFLNEKLIITNIIDVQQPNIVYKKYMKALIFFNQITTGAATEKWNIGKITNNCQLLLTGIIEDKIINCQMKKRAIANRFFDTKGKKKSGNIHVPQYIRELFRYYCEKKTKPRFDDIHCIKLHVSLAECFFGTDIGSKENLNVIADERRKVWERNRNAKKGLGAEMTELMRIDSGSFDGSILNMGRSILFEHNIEVLFPNAEQYVTEWSEIKFINGGYA